MAGASTPSSGFAPPAAATPRGTPSRDAPAKLSLERVLGVTSCSNAAFAVNHITGDAVYAAGCVIVAYNIKRNRQVRFFCAKQPVTCIAVSVDGELIAAGGRGRAALITVWSYSTCTVRAELSEHSGGVAALCFSPDARFLVSVGFKADRNLHVWDWRVNAPRGRRVASGRLSQQVHAVAFAEDATYFVTAGVKHLKFWHMDAVLAAAGATPAAAVTGIAMQAAQAPQAVITLTSRPAIMSESGPDYETFLSLCCGTGAHASRTFALTSAGVICAFDGERVMDEWMHVHVRAGCALDLVNGSLFVACADGIVRVFSQQHLAFKGTLPLPPALGCIGVSVGEAVPACPRDAIYPAALAIRAAGGGQYVAVLYGDRSLFVWDIADVSHVLKYRSQLCHSGPVWDIALCDNAGVKGLPAGSFVTASSDCSIRAWNLNPRASLSRRDASMSELVSPATSNTFSDAPLTSTSASGMDSPMASPTDTPLFGAVPRNLYMREMLQAVYIDESDASSGRDASMNCAAPRARVGPCMAARCIATTPCDAETGLPGAATVMDVGVRAVAARPRSSEIACGDRQGNLRVYDLASGALERYEVAHDAEITSVQYSPASGRLLATASRDRLIHVFDAATASGDRYAVLTTLADHGAPVAAARFAHDDSVLISASDVSMAFSRVLYDGEALQRAGSASTDELKAARVDIAQYKNLTGVRITDVDVDAANKNIVTSGQDGRVNIWSLKTGKLMRHLAIEAGASDLTRLAFDPSGLFVAAASLDRSLRLFDFAGGACMARVVAHSEMMTSVRFTSDCRRLLTAGCDGCVFVWRLAPTLTKAMTDRVREIERMRAAASSLPPRSLGAAALSFGASGVSGSSAVAMSAGAPEPLRNVAPPEAAIERVSARVAMQLSAVPSDAAHSSHVLDARVSAATTPKAAVPPSVPAHSRPPTLPRPAVSPMRSRPQGATLVSQPQAPPTEVSDAIQGDSDASMASLGRSESTSVLDMELRQSILPAWVTGAADASASGASLMLADTQEHVLHTSDSVRSISAPRPTSRWARSMAPAAPPALGAETARPTVQASPVPDTPISGTTPLTDMSAAAPVTAAMGQAASAVVLLVASQDATGASMDAISEHDVDDVDDDEAHDMSAVIPANVHDFSVTSRARGSEAARPRGQSDVLLDGDASGSPPASVTTEETATDAWLHAPSDAPSSIMRQSLSLDYLRQVGSSSARAPAVEPTAPVVTAPADVSHDVSVASTIGGTSSADVSIADASQSIPQRRASATGAAPSRLSSAVAARLRGVAAPAPPPVAVDVSVVLYGEALPTLPAAVVAAPSPHEDLLNESLDLTQLIERARRAAEDEAATAATLSIAGAGTRSPAPAVPAAVHNTNNTQGVRAPYVDTVVAQLQAAVNAAVELRMQMEAASPETASLVAAELRTLTQAMFAAAASLTL